MDTIQGLQKDYHKLLFPYAYNILGVSADAEDAVQDVMSNYFSVQREGIDNVKGYLVKSVINQSISIKSKRKKIEKTDVWLPEPIATEQADTNINLTDIATYSLLVLLEKLTPKERAVFILKEAFGYSHEEIADVISGTIEQSRQLLSRGKNKLNTAPAKSKHVGGSTVYKGILDQYVSAIRHRDTAGLEKLLSKDITFFADGGNLQVAKKRSSGFAEVSELLFFVYEKFQSAYEVESAVINHQPALLYHQGPTLRICQVFEISEDTGKIVRIHSIVDPEKLKHIGKNGLSDDDNANAA